MPITYKARSREDGKKLTAFDGLRTLRTLLRCRLDGRVLPDPGAFIPEPPELTDDVRARFERAAGQPAGRWSSSAARGAIRSNTAKPSTARAPR